MYYTIERIFYSQSNEGGSAPENQEVSRPYTPLRKREHPTVLGRTYSASWSREARRKLNEAVEAGRIGSDHLIGGCEPVFRKRDRGFYP